MNWFYALNGQQAGPVDDAELDRLVQAGTISPTTLIWKNGMAQWQPYSTARGGQPQTATAAPPSVSILKPVASGSVQCSQCGRHLPADEVVRVDNYNVCADCKPTLLQKMREGISPSVGAYGLPVLNYAGFWIRFGAAFLDGLILSPFIFGVFIISWLTEAKISSSGSSQGAVAFLQIVFQWVLPAAYESFFLGRYGATPGKMVCDLKVIRPDGHHLTYARALGRHFAKLLSTYTIFIGYIIIAFDEQKRGLHDYICDSRVVRK